MLNRLCRLLSLEFRLEQFIDSDAPLGPQITALHAGVFKLQLAFVCKVCVCS